MTGLSSLRIDHVRNLSGISLEGFASVNILYGSNGSGKTSVLEAIHYLGTGRSFRSRIHKNVIQHEQTALTVFGATANGMRIGLTREKEKAQLRLNGESVQTASELAAELPLAVFDSSLTELIDGPPAERRSYLDWVLFHVEQKAFISVWRDYQRLLKQRNQLLKRGNISGYEFTTWDAMLASVGEKLYQYRVDVLQNCFTQAEEINKRFNFGFDELSYSLQRGWSSDSTLLACFEESRERDSKFKTTTSGPHRLDFKIKVKHGLAVEVLSRGQLKSLSLMLRMASIAIAAKRSGQEIVLLVDDILGELDGVNKERLLAYLCELKSQIFISCVDKTDVLHALPEAVEAKMFHVEHGKIVTEN